MRNNLAAAILLSAMFALGCGRLQSNSDTSKIIGTNELISVQANGENLPENLRPLINAFGMLKLGCTVTHVGNGIVLTAGHCIPQDIEKGANAACWKDMTIQWNFRTGAGSVANSTCIKVIEAEKNDTHDYAILSVDNAPATKVDVDLEKRPVIDTQITIFGHPMKRPLEWSQYCTVQAVPEKFVSPERFGHQCDTEPGNSGSTIIDPKTLMVIGIHNGGTVPWNYGTFIADTPIAKTLAPLLKQPVVVQ